MIINPHDIIDIFIDKLNSWVNPYYSIFRAPEYTIIIVIRLNSDVNPKLHWHLNRGATKKDIVFIHYLTSSWDGTTVHVTAFFL